VPQRAILVLQQHELTVVVHARVAARVVQQHQGHQAAHLALVRHQREQHAAQADRLLAQLAADHGVGTRREVALVEDQVEDGEHGAQPVGQLVVGRHREGDTGPSDLALGPHETLLHGAFAGQEGAGHLRGREPAEHAQREGHARLGRERRVAAGEEQPQPVVRQRAVGQVVVGLSRHQQLELLQLLLVAALPAQAVDRAVAGGAHDPGAGVVRQPVARPALERHHEGLLDRLLGEVEVGEDADQGRHRPSRLAPEQAVGDLRGRFYDCASTLVSFLCSSEPTAS
jgi:hypothetical protein